MMMHLAINVLLKEGWDIPKIAKLYNTYHGRISSLIKKPKIQKTIRQNRLPELSNFTGREYTRELVRIRDKHTCQKCRKKWSKNKILKQRRFDVHHLNGLCGKKSRGYDKIADIDGLVTLCHKCHFNHPEHIYKAK